MKRASYWKKKVVDKKSLIKFDTSNCTRYYVY